MSQEQRTQVRRKSLHPSSLFHFTETLEVLGSILESGHFHVSYALEHIYKDKKKIPFGVPMCSFCDIRLGSLDAHIENYGAFGLGMKKSWAIANALEPVLYLSKEGGKAAAYFDGLKDSFEQVIIVPGQEDGYHKVFTLQALMKYYKDDLVRKGKETIPDYQHADEREWRFVPDFSDCDRALAFVGEDDLREPNWKDEKNRKIPDCYHLKFVADDVSYIIVKQQCDVVKLEKMLITSHPKFATTFLGRVLTLQQIVDDI